MSMPNSEKPEPLLVTVANAAALLSISKRTAESLIASRRLASVKIGKRRLIKLSSVREIARHGAEIP